MSEKLHEQISALVDNEVNDPELLIRQICKDSALIERWRRHHVIHDVLTSQITADIDLSNRINQAIDAEPAHHSNFALVKKSRVPSSRVRYIMKQAAGLAIAATVSAVAVISVQQNSSSSVVPTLQVARLSPQPAFTQTQVRFVNEPQKLDYKVQSKLSNYLISHNEYSITTNMQGVLPYTRVVTTADQRIVVRSIDEK